MNHTTHYRITINNKDQIITLTKPLPYAPFFQNPTAYCTHENKKIGALIHESDHRQEYYFRNYQDALHYFNYLKQLTPHYLFNNVYE